MLQGSPQFTPRQLLEAGRRAEAEGKLGDADQLYRHLADHFAYTAEAAEARNGLGRISGASQQVWGGNGGEVPASWPTAIGRNDAAAQRGPRTRYVPPERNYLVGRVIAWLMGVLGWLGAISGAGVAALPLLTDPGAWQSALPAGLTPLIAAATVQTGVILAVAGIAAVLIGQVAAALFDQADAARERLALERAKPPAERS